VALVTIAHAPHPAGERKQSCERRTVPRLLCALILGDLRTMSRQFPRSVALLPAVVALAAPARPAAAPAARVTMPALPSVPASLAPRRPPRPLTVGVSLLTRSHQFYKDLEAGMGAEARKYGVRLMVQSAEFRQPDQFRQVQTFVTQRVDALVVCPVDSKGVGTAIRLANRVRIPVFTADIAAQSGNVVCHVASNNEQGGRLVGEYLARDCLGGRGEVAIIDYPTVTSVQERVRGFLAALRRYPGVRVVARPAPERPQQALAFRVAQDTLQAHPNLRGVFGINDDCALGALRAVQATRRKGLAIVGFDATPAAVERIRAGTALQADAAQFPTVIGRATIDAIVRHAGGQPVPLRVQIPTGLVARRPAQRVALSTPALTVTPTLTRSFRIEHE
jgi:ribose transport system substrate-binding protein